MWNEKKVKLVVGIDSGTNTGFACWDKASKKFTEISTLKIHRAMDKIKTMHEQGYDLFVRVEDARKRKWFGNAGREKLQGAGSVKRDAVIWSDFLSDHKIPHEMVAPKNNKTKLNKEQFAKMTGYSGLTSVHSRDASMLCFGF